jgi:nucleoside-diphosphate kinase
MKKILSSLVLFIIKPDAMEDMMEILDKITLAKFTLLRSETVVLDEEQLALFYKNHEGAEWLPMMIEFMKGKKMHVVIFQKKNAVVEFQKLKGDCDPTKAEKDTLRGRYGVTKIFNAVHSSDSEEETMEEIKFFFPGFVFHA